MKKLILLLLFIPLFSFGQITYKDLMKLDSQDAFEKLMFDKRFSAIKEVRKLIPQSALFSAEIVPRTGKKFVNYS